MAKVSVIIPSWNTKGLLKDCLESLLGSSYEDFEVIVVDNASDDGSVEMVQKEFPQVKLIKNQKNLGFAKAVNMGIKKHQPSREDFTGGAVSTTNSSYCLLLNSDTVVEKNTIGKLVKFLNKHPRVAVVGPKLKNADGSWQSSARNFPNIFTHLVEILGLTNKLLQVPLSKQLFSGYYLLWEYQQPHKANWLMGAALMVRTKAIKETGLMDEHYFMYGEEMDWQFQFRKKGWEIWYCPWAAITHLGGKSTEQVKEKSLKWQFENFVYFINKNYNLINQLFLGLATRAGLKMMVWRTQDDRQKKIYQRVLDSM